MSDEHQTRIQSRSPQEESNIVQNTLQQRVEELAIAIRAPSRAAMIESTGHTGMADVTLVSFRLAITNTTRHGVTLVRRRQSEGVPW